MVLFYLREYGGAALSALGSSLCRGVLLTATALSQFGLTIHSLSSSCLTHCPLTAWDHATGQLDLEQRLVDAASRYTPFARISSPFTACRYLTGLDPQSVQMTQAPLTIRSQWAHSRFECSTEPSLKREMSLSPQKHVTIRSC